MILSGSNSMFKIFYLIKIEKKNTYLTCSIHIDIGVVCQGKCPSCFSIQIFAELRNYNFAIAVFFYFNVYPCIYKKIDKVLIKKKDNKPVNLSRPLEKKLQREFVNI